MFSYHETQNAPHRRTMEDAHIFHPSAAPPLGPRTALVAVLDGHGGSRTALDIVLDQLPAIIGDEMRGHPPGVSGSRRKSIKAAMIGAFARMDQELRPCAWQNGLTATVLLIKRQKDKKSNKDCCTVICANVGDSRAILVAPSGRLTRLTQDHRPTSNAAETDRVVNNGGVVLFGRVGGQLAVSRALGDWCLKNDGVISEPSVSVKREVVQGSIVVAASDGVWDVLGDEEVATFVSMHINEEDVAEKLVVIHRPADERFSDNVYFGIEGYSPTPKLGFMAKITARILMSISTRLAAAHESRLISNFPNTSQQGERTYFLFPLTSADTVIEHSSGGGSGDCEAVDLPDITSDRGIYGKVSSNHKFDTGHIYTFCYWSMFVDFVTWDLRNLPAISGTSLCTLLGPQPIHIVMRDDKGTCFMNILSAHK
ncbi:hypothetical protein FOL46_000693, partial [Perkinsus olseni]